MRLNFRSKWASPIVAVLMGAAFFLASWIAGEPKAGLASFAVMAVVGAMFAFGGPSETISLMRQPDERWTHIDLKATAFAGFAMAAAVIVGSLIRIAGNRDIGILGVIAVVGGVAYLGALLWLRSRS